MEWGLSPSELLTLPPEVVESVLELIAKRNEEVKTEETLRELRARG